MHKIVKGIFNKSLQERVRIDIELHNMAIKDCEETINYYTNANIEKLELLDILNGKITNRKQIIDYIKKLKKCRRTHLYSRNNKEWNKLWIKIYDEWIKHLKEVTT